MLSDPRVFFAAERTLLAWVRTGLTIMAFGFVVARFGLFLRLLAAQHVPGSTPSQSAHDLSSIARHWARGSWHCVHDPGCDPASQLCANVAAARHSAVARRHLSDLVGTVSRRAWGCAGALPRDRLTLTRAAGPAQRPVHDTSALNAGEASLASSLEFRARPASPTAPATLANRGSTSQEEWRRECRSE